LALCTAHRISHIRIQFSIYNQKQYFYNQLVTVATAQQQTALKAVTLL